MREVLNAGMHEPVGPYSPIVKAGDYVFVSGQVGDRDGLTGQYGDIREQTKQAMEHMKELLLLNHLSMEHIVKCNIYLKDRKCFDGMNQVYAQYFKSYPARITVYVSDLYDGCDVEIDAIAYVAA